MPLRASVGSTNAPIACSMLRCVGPKRKALLSPCGFHYHSDWPVP